jgi:hypothetical protein
MSLVGQLNIYVRGVKAVSVEASLHMQRLEMALFKDVTEQPS